MEYVLASQNGSFLEKKRWQGVSMIEMHGSTHPSYYTLWA